MSNSKSFKQRKNKAIFQSFAIFKFPRQNKYEFKNLAAYQTSDPSHNKHPKSKSAFVPNFKIYSQLKKIFNSVFLLHKTRKFLKFANCHNKRM